MPGSPESTPHGPVAEPSRRQILAGSSGTAVAIVAAQIVAGLSFLVLARRLVPEDLGTFAVLYTVGGALGGVLDFGSSQLRSRELAKGVGLESFTSWLWRRAVWQAPIVVAGIGLAQILAGPRVSLLVTASLMSQGLTVPIQLGCTGALRALRSPALGTWLVASGNVLLLAVVLAAPGQLLIEAAAIAATASWLVTAGGSWWLVREPIGPKRSCWRTNPWAGSSGFGIFGLAVVLQGLQVVIVGTVASRTAAGELAAVARWAQPVYLVAAAFSTQTFPSMAAAVSDVAARRILRPVWNVCALGVVVAIGIVVLAPLLVRLLLGADYSNSVVLLRALAIAAIPVLLTQPLGTFLQARGSERAVAVATTVAVMASLAATAVGAEALGALAAPLSSGLTQCALFLVLLRVLRARQAGFGPNPTEESVGAA